MDVNIKVEPKDTDVYNEITITQEVKEENEVILSSEKEWEPIKFEDEQSEYIREFGQCCGEQVERPKDHVNPDSSLNRDSSNIEDNLEFLDADDYEEYNFDVDEDSDYFYSESDEDDKNMSYDEEDSEEKLNMAHEYNLIIEKQDEQLSPSESKICANFTLDKWLIDQYVKRECPTCNEHFCYPTEWRKHITSHKDVIKEFDLNYEMTDRGGVCKKCNQVRVCKLTRYLHSISHTEHAKILDINICKLCHFSSSKLVLLQKHIKKKHPETVETFKNTVKRGRLSKCPICNCVYTEKYELCYHFMDEHPKEHKEKFQYICHLCQHDPYVEEDIFFGHLIEKHELNSWNVLNFRKLFENKEYFACKECHIVFIKNDIRKFLKHFLEHEPSSHWRCKFCLKKISIKFTDSSHMCLRLLSHFSKLNKNNKLKAQTACITKKIQNLQEFEECIIHVCPFCKTEFNKMQKWQEHLRTIHEIHTLKGLDMKRILADNNKLYCVLCCAVVPNSPMQLHAHRFQHLPYKPYKCRHCTQLFETFKIAVSHVSTRCQDVKDTEYIKRVLLTKTNAYKAKAEIRCVFCNYKKFPHFTRLIDHYKKDHNNFQEFFDKNPNTDTFTCKICQKQVTKCHHVHSHFAEKAFNCPFCLCSYNTSRSCNRHLLLNHFVKPLDDQKAVKPKNQIPGEQFSEQPDLEVPPLAKLGTKTYVLNEFAEFLVFACPECNEGMPGQEDWHRHITTKHNFFDKKNLCIKNVDGILKCPLCKLNLPASTIQQQKHKITHMPYRPFICKLCYTRCNSLGVLYGHFRKRHFSQGNFECPVCREVLSTEHQQTQHLKNTHPREEWPTNTCLVCYKVLSSKSSLNYHMCTHDIERPKYTCAICESKLIGYRDFKLHTARHEERGEVPKHKPQIQADEISTLYGSHSYDVEKKTEEVENVCKAKNVNVNKIKFLSHSLKQKKRKFNRNK